MSPSIPKPVPPPKPPQIDQAAQTVDQQNRLLRRRGYASTVLTKGDLAPATVGVSRLLGT